MTRPDPEEILQRATLNAGPLLAFLGEDQVASRLGWPASAVRTAQAHPRLRRRLALAMGRRLSLSPDELRRAAALLPRDQEALGTARLMFGLAVALASHAGVFRRAEYASLQGTFGRVVLDFAMQHRTRLPAQAQLPRIVLEREEVEACGRAELHRTLRAAAHPLAKILASGAPSGDGDQASPEPSAGTDEAAAVRAGPAREVGRPALLVDLAEAALAASALPVEDGSDPPAEADPAKDGGDAP